MQLVVLEGGNIALKHRIYFDQKTDVTLDFKSRGSVEALIQSPVRKAL